MDVEEIKAVNSTGGAVGDGSLNPNLNAPVRCVHWFNCNIRGGGCCKIDAYPRPSWGTCDQCEKYDGPERRAGKRPSTRRRPHAVTFDQWRQAAKNVAGGVVGLAMAVVSQQKAAAFIQQMRLATCNKCEYQRPCFPGGPMCCGSMLDAMRPGSKPCGCMLKAKIKDPRQKCPLDPPKW